VKILIVGGGGREHTLAWKLRRAHGEAAFVAPGNAGTRQVAENVPIVATDIEGLANWAEEQGLILQCRAGGTAYRRVGRCFHSPRAEGVWPYARSGSYRGEQGFQ